MFAVHFFWHCKIKNLQLGFHRIGIATMWKQGFKKYDEARSRRAKQSLTLNMDEKGLYRQIQLKIMTYLSWSVDDLFYQLSILLLSLNHHQLKH